MCLADRRNSGDYGHAAPLVQRPCTRSPAHGGGAANGLLVHLLRFALSRRRRVTVGGFFIERRNRHHRFSRNSSTWTCALFSALCNVPIATVACRGMTQPESPFLNTAWLPRCRTCRN